YSPYPSSSSENDSGTDPTYFGLTRVQRSRRELHSPSCSDDDLHAGGTDFSIRVSNNPAEDFGRHSVFYRSDKQIALFSAFSHALDPETYLPPPSSSSSSS